jgi:hypothetical protein
VGGHEITKGCEQPLLNSNVEYTFFLASLPVYSIVNAMKVKKIVNLRWRFSKKSKAASILLNSAISIQESRWFGYCFSLDYFTFAPQ